MEAVLFIVPVTDLRVSVQPCVSTPTHARRSTAGCFRIARSCSHLPLVRGKDGRAAKPIVIKWLAGAVTPLSPSRNERGVAPRIKEVT